MSLSTKAITIYTSKKADFYNENNNQGYKLLLVKLD